MVIMCNVNNIPRTHINLVGVHAAHNSVVSRDGEPLLLGGTVNTAIKHKHGFFRAIRAVHCP